MYEYHTLSNGLKIILSRTQSPVAYSGVYIGVGSRDEQGSDEGIAHFIEHCIFKGTTHRRAYHILNRIDALGGELNAFTTKEETCIYATSLVKNLDRCLDLFADILFNSNFPEREIITERDVVLEEINSYNDTPSELIYDRFEELAFAPHPLAHNILGSKQNVRHFTPDSIRAFMQGRYIPSRMVITVVADISMSKLVRMCERLLGSFESNPLHFIRPPKPTFNLFHQHIRRSTHQCHILIGCEAPDIYNTKKTPFTLLNNILGGPAMNSRLNISIREKYGFCYTVESQYVPFTDSGIFYIYAGVDAHYRERAISLILSELQRIASEPLSSTQLLRAQQQMIGQMTINNDLGMNEMQSIGKAFLCFEQVDTLEQMNSDILSITSNDLQKVASEFFSSDKISILTFDRTTS